MTRLDALRATVGDLARPFAIYAASGSASVATVKLAWTDADLNAAAIYMTAIWAGVGALYWGKSFEKQAEHKADAQVRVAQAQATSPSPAQAPPSPGTARVEAAADVQVTVTDAPTTPATSRARAVDDPDATP